jgi:hypothetical protein
MPTGGFIGYAPSSFGSISLGAGTLWLTPLVAPRNAAATAVLMQSTSAQSGFNLKALIYNSAHSTLLATGSTVTSTTANYNRLPLTANLSLTAGTTYYVGYICDGSFSLGRESSTGPGSWYAPGSTTVASPPNPLASGSTNSITIMIGLELDGTGAAGFGWGVLDDSAGVTLSLSNTVATCSTSANQGARSVITVVNGTGKYYAEIAVSGTINNLTAVGLASVNWGTAQGFTTGGAPGFVGFLHPDGGLSSGSSVSITYVSGDIIGIAYDAVAQLLWFNRNNGAWWGVTASSGNPVTGTNGWSFNTTNWPMAIGGMTATGTAAIFGLRDTTASLQYAPPSGYLPWSPYVAPPTARPAQYAVTVVS